MRHSFLPAILFAVTVAAGATEPNVRSELYPADWKPGFTNAEGYGIPDFSCAGYRQGEEPPANTRIDFNAGLPPYSADPSGQTDATAAIQRALDDAGRQGGGTVYLPAGTYRLTFADRTDAALRIKSANVVLRGAGVDRTKLILDAVDSRQKSVILAAPEQPAWNFDDSPQTVAVTADLPVGVRVIPVAAVDALQKGDTVLLRHTVTEDFIAEHHMTGRWKPTDRPMRGIALLRRIVAVDPVQKTVTLDAPTFYPLKTRDNTRLCKIEDRMLKNIGFEDFSIGMKELPGLEWGGKEGSNADYGKPEHPAYRLHGSTALRLAYCEDSYIRRVNSCKPAGNADTHIHSNGIRLSYSRRVTVSDCVWQNPLYRGGGGNGYLYTLSSSDCLIRDCKAYRGRHNYDFQTMHTSGNVILRCLAAEGMLSSDFHMYLSTGNLVDSTTCDRDFWHCGYRPYGSGVMHGESGAGNVFWNTKGLRYADGRNFIIDARQRHLGVIVGTSGPASAIAPECTGFKEWIGQGERLEPQSVYEDQRARAARRGN
jgi:hypothetical protein